MSVNFFNESIKFELKNKRLLKKWILDIILEEGKKLGEINYIFCSDDYVKEINQKYLKHNYYTDIITFNYNSGGVLSGDIFISIDTVRENAITYNVSFEQEVFRVIIHGVLHLIGFDDTSESLQIIMRSKENLALDNLFSKLLIK